MVGCQGKVGRFLFAVYAKSVGVSTGAGKDLDTPTVGRGSTAIRYARRSPFFTSK